MTHTNARKKALKKTLQRNARFDCFVEHFVWCGMLCIDHSLSMKNSQKSTITVLLSVAVLFIITEVEAFRV